MVDCGLEVVEERARGSRSRKRGYGAERLDAENGGRIPPLLGKREALSGGGAGA
jgi:hypothetical protein